MMRQAGRYQKAYRDLALKHPSFRERSENTDLIVEISLQPWESFRPDGVILFRCLWACVCTCVDVRNAFCIGAAERLLGGWQECWMTLDGWGVLQLLHLITGHAAGDAGDMAQTPDSPYPLCLPVRSDILTPLPAFGIPFEIDDDKGPLLANPIRSTEQLAALHPIDLDQLSFVGESLGLIRQQVGGQAATLGFVGCPWTLATYVVEGASSSIYKNIKSMMFNGEG